MQMHLVAFCGVNTLLRYAKEPSQDMSLQNDVATAFEDLANSVNKFDSIKQTYFLVAYHEISYFTAELRGLSI